MQYTAQSDHAYKSIYKKIYIHIYVCLYISQAERKVCVASHHIVIHSCTALFSMGHEHMQIYMTVACTHKEKMIVVKIVTK